jgi:dimethylamine/trimethylamine dehydrogenase
VVPSHVVVGIEDDGTLRGHNVWIADPVGWRADAAVLVTQREPCDALYHEVVADSDRLAAEGIEAVYRIGDCLAPRLIADCIFDGHRLAREIDAADAATPLPFVREVVTVPAA